MKDDSGRLSDMLEAIEKIEKYTVRGQQVFEQDELVQSWVVRHLQVLGEAARKTSEELRSRHPPEVAWSGMIGMRHILVHDYDEVNLRVAWSTVTEDLPVLKEQLSRILRANP